MPLAVLFHDSALAVLDKPAAPQRLAGACLLRVRPGTGGTHQIRVQFSEAGFPRLGDEVQGTAHPGIRRPALHAERLAFPHPLGGERIECAAALPEDFSRLLADLGCKSGA